jgi:hypothetical protein
VSFNHSAAPSLSVKTLYAIGETMQEQEKCSTKSKNNPNRLGHRWFVPKSPVKTSARAAADQRRQQGEADVTIILESPSSSSSSESSHVSKANGIPCWEHPKKVGAKSKMPTLNLNDMPLKSPRRKIQTSPVVRKPSHVGQVENQRGHPNFENLVPTLDLNDMPPKSPRRKIQTSPVVRKPSPVGQVEIQKRHPNFENLVITLRREDSVTSIGDLTFDESITYDMNYQRHQERTQRDRYMELNIERNRIADPRMHQPRRKKSTEERTRTSKSSKTKKSTSEVVRPGLDDYSSKPNSFSGQRPSMAELAKERTQAKSSKQARNDVGHVDNHSPNSATSERARIRRSTQIKGGESLSSSEMYGSVDYCAVEMSNSAIDFPSQRKMGERKQSNSKHKKKNRENESFEGSEVSGEPVSLSSLYNSWKGQSENASVPSSPCTLSGRSTLQMPSPIPSTRIGMDSMDNSNNTGTSYSVTQDDTNFIFGGTRVLELEQEQAMFNLAVRRSLEDLSSHSSMSGYSSQASRSTRDSAASSCDTGQHAVRLGRYQPQRPIIAYGGGNGSQQRSMLSGAGCHLAMIASNAHITRRPSTMVGEAMLQSIDDDSEEEEDLPYTAHADGETTFVWKRDPRTNRWYKKPVFANAVSTLSEEDRILEEAKQKSVRDAMSNSFVELQDTAATHFGACLHW